MLESDLSIRELLGQKIETKRKELDTVKENSLIKQECTQLDEKKEELKLHKEKWFQCEIIKNK